MATGIAMEPADHPCMRFLALATSDDAWFREHAPAENADVSSEEARRAWELYEAGVIRAIHWRTDRRDVVIELEASTEADALAALGSLPFVALGAVTFELVGLRPYDGWRRLFEPGEAARAGEAAKAASDHL